MQGDAPPLRREKLPTCCNLHKGTGTGKKKFYEEKNRKCKLSLYFIEVE